MPPFSEVVVMITGGFDIYGHNWRTFFKKIALFSTEKIKENIIFVDKLVSF